MLSSTNISLKSVKMNISTQISEGGVVFFLRWGNGLPSVIFVPLLSFLNDLPVTGVRGNSLTLRCPIDQLDGSTTRRIRKDWLKIDNNKEKSIAKLVMVNSVMEYNDTTLGSAWISSLDGDLTIQNLRHVDAGVYKCRFTGSRDGFIKLVVTGELILYWYMVFWLAHWYLDWEKTNGWYLFLQLSSSNGCNICRAYISLTSKLSSHEMYCLVTQISGTLYELG